MRYLLLLSFSLCAYAVESTPMITLYPPVQYQATKPDFMAGRGGVKLGQ